MKKTLLIGILCLAFLLQGVAQTLQYTKWKKYDSYFNDTLVMKFRDSTFSANTSTEIVVSGLYTENGNIITFQDLSGPSACPSSQIGTYTFSILSNIMHFELVNDLCQGRVNSTNGANYCRIPGEMIHVPADYPTIAEGIDAAFNCDTVMVSDGLYYENINFLGKKPFIVASEFLVDGDTSHISNTIINGSQPVNPDIGSVVTFGSGEDTTSVLCGFTITGGTGTFVPDAGNARFGGGVFIIAGGKLLNNYIEYNIMTNEGWSAGGGVASLGPYSPLPYAVLRGNRISHNQALSTENEGNGGGVANFYNLVMIDNQVSYNEASGPYRGDGGGIFIHGDWGHIELDIRNNSIVYNRAASNSGITDLVISGGIDIFNDCSGRVANNLIAFNEIEVAAGQTCYGTGAMVEQIAADDFVFENNLVTDNSFTGDYCWGGGLCIYGGTGKFQNNVFQRNSGTYGGGITIGYNGGFKVTLINNTITGNESAYGGGIYTYLADAVVINTIIWGNTAAFTPSIHQQLSNLEVRYSDVEGALAWPGEGNLICEPMLFDDGYHIFGSCSLVNAGIAEISIDGVTYYCPELDIDGESRPYQAQPEIGVDEVTFVSTREKVPVQGFIVNLLPNPCSKMLTISTSNGENLGEMTIFSQTGQEILHTTISQPSWQFDVSSLPAGLYTVRVTGKSASQVVKFIKQ
jgi:hypothetical protein